MAQQVTHTFDEVPTFNEFDTQMRTARCEQLNHERNNTYRTWGDETLQGYWLKLVIEADEKGYKLPEKVVKCVEMKGYAQNFKNKDYKSIEAYEDVLYPQPVASMK